jgi:predicted HicB family RNase H-like nuclease
MEDGARLIVATKSIMGVWVKKRMGRPPKLKSERRSRTLRLRMSDVEYRRLAEKAKAAGLSVSEFVRERTKD